MKVAVICNLNAQRVKRGIGQRIKAILKNHALFVAETEKIDEVYELVDRNLSKADIWCFVGGDGTLNSGLSILWQKTGMKDELEIPVLHGKAGSLNAIPDKIPLKGNLDDIMLRFKDLLMSYHRARRIPRDNIRKFNTIKLTTDTWELPRICFTFFLGTPYFIAKKVIETRLASKRSILQMIYSSIAKFVLGQDKEKLIRRVKAEIHTDGKKYPYVHHYVVIGSVFRAPALFFSPFVEPEKYKGGFYFLVYSGDVWTALKNFRTYATGKKRPPHSFNDIVSEVEIKAWGGIDFDGELESPKDEKTPIEIKAENGPIVNLIKV